MILSLPRADARVNWRQVGLFVALTFGLSWILDAAIVLTVGYGSQASGLLLQLQMLLPAFSAILLGTLFFSSSPIHRKVKLGRPRIFFGYFLAYALIYMALGVASIAMPQQIVTFSLAGLALTFLGLVLLVVLRVVSGRESFRKAGLSGGKFRYWALFGAGFLLFYLLQTLLNYLFGLGQPVDVSPLARQAQMPESVFLTVAGVQTILVGPFLGLVIAFGEEYGWRGYLQGELIKLGRVRGVLLVGTIWGLWHAPIIVMGHNYPGYPVAGVFLMVGYCITLGYVLGYAMLKSGSVWLAAFLHALNNQALAYLSLVIYTPSNPVFCFGAGLFGILSLALVALLVLRDPIWRGSDAEPQSAG